ncbi:MAG: hypothetical protein AB1798_10975 [Spirochaetota bacterium]
MKYKNVVIEDVHCECTDMFICRTLLTSLSEETALNMALYISGYSVITTAPIQVCLEGILPASETPDGRTGVIIQFNAPTAVTFERFRKALLDRLFVLPHLPTCSLFNLSAGEQETTIEVGQRLGRWGDGFKKRVTINEGYCPTLKDEIADSKVPKGAEAAIEYLLVGINEELIRGGLKIAIDAFASIPGIKSITSPSFGGRWGTHKLYLPEIVGLRPG